jgi:hypothetical protein
MHFGYRPDETGVLLFDVPLEEPRIRAQPRPGKSAALADTATVALEFSGLEVAATQQVASTIGTCNAQAFGMAPSGPRPVGVAARSA